MHARVRRLMMRGLMLFAACAVGVQPIGVRPIAAQEVALGERGPRFLFAPTPEATPKLLDVRSAAVLRDQMALDLDNVTVAEALATITRLTKLDFAYSRDLVSTTHRVNLRADRITVAAALTEILFDANVDVVLSSGRKAALVRRTAAQVRQPGSIAGRVTDAKTGDPLAGAEVWVEGTRARTSTGEKGFYKLAEVEAGTFTLSVRRLGYAKSSRSVTVTADATLNADFALEPVVRKLDELVTTATGEQRLRELGHVVGRINADSLVKEAPVSTLSELLTGRVPGLQVFQSQGTVGGQVQLRIRGANSLVLGNEPIVIIDGVRYTTTSRTALFMFSPGNVEQSSPLNDINPNDIESIEVVKGPSAATLYGTDAVNGVVVVTTKRGQPGRDHFNVYAKTTMTSIPRFDYPDIYFGYGLIFGQPNHLSPGGTNCRISMLAEGICSQQDSVVPMPNPLNDPEFTILGNKPQREYGVNASGGRQELRYYFAGIYEDATGPIQMPPAVAEQLKLERGLKDLPEEWRQPNGLTKTNLRANVSATPGTRADLMASVGYIRSDYRNIGGAGADRNPYLAPYLGNPSAETPYFPGEGDPRGAFLQKATERVERWIGNISGHVRPISWLALHGSLGLDLSNSHRYALARPGDASQYDYFAGYQAGRVEDSRTTQTSLVGDVGATATLRSGPISARTVVGGQYTRSQSDALGGLGTGLPFGGSSVTSATDRQVAQTYTETVVLGGFVEETMGFNDRLFLTGAVRFDGASTFGRNYNAVAYPKLGVSWLLSEEPFVPKVPRVDELRLRFALGSSGQQPLPSWARPTFYNFSRPLPGGGAEPVVGISGVGNPDLRPERVREIEFGADVTAFTGRMVAEATWYRRRTTDAITTVSTPATISAYGQYYTNLGLMRQTGFELSLRARILESRSLTWTVTLQHASQLSTVLDAGGVSGSEYLEGHPLGGRFAVPVTGFEDRNGDGYINPYSEIQVGADRVYVGESTPPRTQTLTTVLGLFQERLRLSALIERKAGFTQINDQRCAKQTCQAAVDASTPLADQVKAMIESGQLNSRGVISTEPGDFMRLREVSAAVDLPGRFTKALKLQSASFVLSVRNLALWTDYSGPDPESATVSRGVYGASALGIPQGRVVSMRLDLGL